jgi:membrane-bound inhibitor of C-type lysozyme
MRGYRAALFLIALSLAACAERRKPQAAPAGDSVATLIAEPTQFLCQDSAGFAARFQGDSAFLSMPGDTLRILARQPSASGVRYGDGTFTLLAKGDSASLLMGDSVLHGGCVAGARKQ